MVKEFVLEGVTNLRQLIVRRHNLRHAAQLSDMRSLRIYDLAGTVVDASMSHVVTFIDDDGQSRLLKGEIHPNKNYVQIQRPITPASTQEEVQAYLQNYARDYAL